MSKERIAAHKVYTLAQAEPLVDAFIEYDSRSGRILGVGKCEDFSREENVVSGALVPGFVNAHCHLELSHMKGCFTRGVGMNDFVCQITGIRNDKTHQQILDCIQQWLDYMWRSGVSAMADISNCSDSFSAKAASPMYTRTFLEVLDTEPANCTRVMAEAAALVEKARSLGLDAAPTPHAYYTMSRDLITAASAAGLAAGFLSYHSEESPQEQEMSKYGRGPLHESRLAQGFTMPPVTGKSTLMYFFDILKEIHPAPYPEHILLVHEVTMDEEGMDRVKEEMPGACIALCPMSNIYIHNQLPPVPLMKAKGLKLCIGTDSLSSNDNLDMVTEMLCLQENFPALSLQDLLSWACLGGAGFLGKEDVLGSIEPGKTPGIVEITHLTSDGRLSTASKSRRIV